MTKGSQLLPLLLLVVAVLPLSHGKRAKVVDDSTAPSYGLGCSWPMENGVFACDDALLGGVEHRLAIYRDYLKGCVGHYGQEPCDKEEAQRVLDNSIKPMSMRNYTNTGFMKTQVPHEIMTWLNQHWQDYKNDNLQEFWGNAKLPRNNMWVAPANHTNMHRNGHDNAVKSMEIMKPIVEKWTGGVDIRPTSMYGIRVYQRGTIIVPHVDRYPLIISAIINVDQDVEEPWPLEVIDRDGKAVNVTLQPGEMVLYEGHTTIHSRPFPLKGNFYANAFVHFEPISPSKTTTTTATTLEEDGLPPIPPYLIRGSPYEKEVWHKDHPDGWSVETKTAMEMIGTPDFDHATVAAAWGNLGYFENLVKTGQADRLHEPDENGWLPIHEAARFGQINAVKYLLQHGADINHVTPSGDTPLSAAMENQINQHGRDHQIVNFLIKEGAMTPEQLLVKELLVQARSSQKKPSHRNHRKNAPDPKLVEEQPAVSAEQQQSTNRNKWKTDKGAH